MKLPNPVRSNNSAPAVPRSKSASNRNVRPQDGIEDPWKTLSESNSQTYPRDNDSDGDSDFDDDLNDFGGGSGEEFFTDDYAVPTTLPPGRLRKVAVSQPDKKQKQGSRPFPWGIVMAVVAAVCIIGLLVPLALTLKTVVTQANHASQLSATKNHMKQLGLGFHNFHDVYNSFPVPQMNRSKQPEWYDRNGRPFLSWRVHILPFIDQADLYRQFHLDEPWDSEHNRTLLSKMPTVFQSRSVQLKPGHTCMQAPSGHGTVMDGGVACSIGAVTDGTFNTVMLVQTDPSRAVPWTQPADYDVDPGEAVTGLHFTGGVTLILTCDGSVHACRLEVLVMNGSEDSATSVLSLLFTKAEGKVLDQGVWGQ